jgi:hypothetical protein
VRLGHRRKSSHRSTVCLPSQPLGCDTDAGKC